MNPNETAAALRLLAYLCSRSSAGAHAAGAAKRAGRWAHRVVSRVPNTQQRASSLARPSVSSSVSNSLGRSCAAYCFPLALPAAARRRIIPCLCAALWCGAAGAHCRRPAAAGLARCAPGQHRCDAASPCCCWCGHCQACPPACDSRVAPAVCVAAGGGGAAARLLGRADPQHLVLAHPQLSEHVCRCACGAAARAAGSAWLTTTAAACTSACCVHTRVRSNAMAAAVPVSIQPAGGWAWLRCRMCWRSSSTPASR